MTGTKVTLRNLNIAPRKVRLVATSIKGLHVQSALAQLDLMPQRSTGYISKLLKSAIASAKEKNLDVDKLIVKTVKVDKGAVLKRSRARAKGRATLIEKKMSNITLELEESESAKKPSFVIQEKVKEEKKKQAPRQEKKPKVAHEETRKEKERSGFKDKFFRRKSV